METGISNSHVRMENRKKLIKLLYWNKGISKQDISAGMQLSMPTVNLLISQLNEQGLIEKRRAEVSSGGRIPDLFYFKYDAKFSVGVEIQKNYCILLITNLSGEQKAYKRIKARFSDSRTYWLGLRALILQVISESGIEKGDVLGVGIALQNSVEDDRQVTEMAFARTDRRRRFEKLDVLLGFPVLVESDTNAAGFANIWTEKTVGQAIYLSVSEQVESVIIADRRIVHGTEGRCGKIGYMKLGLGDRSYGGDSGNVNEHCSTGILTKAVNDDLGKFFELLSNSEALERIWSRYTDILAVLIANINMMLDFPVILGGELGKYIAYFEGGLEQKIEENHAFYTEKVLAPASVCENAPAVGAALMIAAYYLELREEE